MTSWADVERAAPELAAAVRGRFEATGLAILATVRADGSPRVSGIEVDFSLGELWIGSMPAARKTLDLRRDPRCALHAATADKDVTDGDAKLAARAVLVGDDRRAAWSASRAESGEHLSAPDPFDLYRLDVAELSFLRPAGDHLVIEWWTPTGGLRRVERR